MKIIQVIPSFTFGGAEIMCENLIYELRKNNHVIAISLYDERTPISQRLEDVGVDVRYLGKKKGLDFSMIKKLRKIFKSERPDVVHTHLAVMKYVIPALAMLGIKKRVHTIHNVADKESVGFEKTVNRYFYKFCGVVPVALSELVRDSIVREYSIKEEGVPIILNGVNLTKCKPKEDYSINEIFKIIHVGRFSEQKNHIGLLKAFNIFHKECEKSQLWLLGDGEKRLEIEAFVKENGLEESVKLWGIKSSVHEYLNEADIFTLPSNYEGVPLTLIEAMGTGLPIVATAVGGIPDMVENEKSAILTELNETKIAEAFFTLFNDQEKRKTLGQNAKNESHKFSAKTMAEKYYEVYERI